MALTWTPPETATEQVRQVKSQTDNPFLVNFALSFSPDSLDAALKAGAPVVTFSWGDPEAFLPKVRDAGVPFGIQVTCVGGVKRAIAQGASFLICQGLEAGGHVQSTVSLWELLPRILEAADGVPVIAAGGMATGKHIARALAAGAKGAILGTRFVATQESRAHPEYKRHIVESQGDTSLTVCFEGGWPYSAHRVLRNSTLEAWEASGCPTIGARPGEGDVIAHTAGGDEIIRYETTCPRDGYTGDIEAMCLYSGTGVGSIDDIPSAGELVERLWRDCLEAL